MAKYGMVRVATSPARELNEIKTVKDIISDHFNKIMRNEYK